MKPVVVTFDRYVGSEGDQLAAGVASDGIDKANAVVIFMLLIWVVSCWRLRRFRPRAMADMEAVCPGAPLPSRSCDVCTPVERCLPRKDT